LTIFSMAVGRPFEGVPSVLCMVKTQLLHASFSTKPFARPMQAVGFNSPVRVALCMFAIELLTKRVSKSATE
jgi:hypothetical protein